MTNHDYDQTTLVGFQVSLLGLAAALDQARIEGSTDDSAVARGEAERLKALADRRDD